jgi:hypothetical protein
MESKSEEQNMLKGGEKALLNPTAFIISPYNLRIQRMLLMHSIEIFSIIHTHSFSMPRNVLCLLLSGLATP